jgi:hypothetical protein
LQPAQILSKQSAEYNQALFSLMSGELRNMRESSSLFISSSILIMCCNQFCSNQKESLAVEIAIRPEIYHYPGFSHLELGCGFLR